MNKIVFIPVILTILISITACKSSLIANDVNMDSNITNDTGITSSIQSATDKTEISSKATQIDFPYFTKQQIMDDYSILLDILDKNYPNFTTAKHLYGSDKDEIYAKYKNVLDTHDNSFNIEEAAQYFSNLITEFGGTGHLTLMDFNSYQGLYTAAEAAKNTDKAALEAFNIANNANVKRVYQYFSDNNILWTTNYPRRVVERTEIPINLDGLIDINQNLSYKEINKTTVYLNILSFMQWNVEPDRQLLLDFFKQIHEYGNLIIDITSCNGGSNSYWESNIVQPNITNDYIIPSYSLSKSTGIYSYLADNNDYNRSSKIYRTISKLPYISQEALSEFDIAKEDDLKINSLGSSTNYQGKIYVLVGGNVLSAAEAFAQFCKNSGFAVLVGKNTGGDVGNIALREFILPNTGLLVRFDTYIPLNSDGSSNTEFGTTPDFFSVINQSALDKCLEIISN